MTPEFPPKNIPKLTPKMGVLDASKKVLKTPQKCSEERLQINSAHFFTMFPPPPVLGVHFYEKIPPKTF